MKSLRATKVKDGWYVEITRVIVVPHKVDVFKLAKQEGLKVDRRIFTSTVYQSADMIFAD